MEIIKDYEMECKDSSFILLKLIKLWMDIERIDKNMEEYSPINIDDLKWKMNELQTLMNYTIYRFHYDKEEDKLYDGDFIDDIRLLINGHSLRYIENNKVGLNASGYLNALKVILPRFNDDAFWLLAFKNKIFR